MTLDRIHVLTALRKRILDNHYAPGTRMAEIPVAAELGVSRTPVRLAFRTLEQEGLLEKTGARGYVVRRFSDEDLLCGLEVRGVLEGLAARRLAERGMERAVESALRECLRAGAQCLADGRLSDRVIDGWSAANRRFHETIVGAARSRAVADAIARNNHLPFASSDSIVIDTLALEREYQKLRIAQFQHELIVDALCAGEGARAEMLVREHAYIGLRYGRLIDAAAADPPCSPTSSTTVFHR